VCQLSHFLLTDLIYLLTTVSRIVSDDATTTQCQNRYFRSLDPDLKKGAWSPEEDARLRLSIGLYGHSWVDIATVMPGRSNEQCRDRWSERLNPNVAKGKWTEEEDTKLLAVIEDLTDSGNFGWKQVSERLATGRTDNMVNLLPS
jgi:Myb-like DNA-binding domain